MLCFFFFRSKIVSVWVLIRIEKKLKCAMKQNGREKNNKKENKKKWKPVDLYIKLWKQREV